MASKSGNCGDRVRVCLGLSYHLRDRPLKDQDNQQLLWMLRRYHQLGDLLRFLEQPEVEPTNNRVERILRPVVIVRKISQCSKAWPGPTPSRPSPVSSRLS
jgi:hypothetical protein